jgi:hypothetical protein
MILKKHVKLLKIGFVELPLGIKMQLCVIELLKIGNFFVQIFSKN